MHKGSSLKIFKMHICIIYADLNICIIFLKCVVLMITLRVDSCKRKLSTVINLKNECNIRHDTSTRSAILELASWFLLTTENLGRGCGS